MDYRLARCEFPDLAVHDNVSQWVSNLACHCGRENILTQLNSEYKPYLPYFLTFFQGFLSSYFTWLRDIK